MLTVMFMFRFFMVIMMEVIMPTSVVVVLALMSKGNQIGTGIVLVIVERMIFVKLFYLRKPQNVEQKPIGRVDSWFWWPTSSSSATATSSQLPVLSKVECHLYFCSEDDFFFLFSPRGSQNFKSKVSKPCPFAHCNKNFTIVNKMLSKVWRW